MGAAQYRSQCPHPPQAVLPLAMGKRPPINANYQWPQTLPTFPQGFLQYSHSVGKETKAL